MHLIPDEFCHGPFSRPDALRAGISARVLEGVQFRRIHQGVYRHRDHTMTFADLVAAARLALPESARTTGLTRLQELGVDFGPRSPLHFVVESDLHLTLEGVFLHRTVKQPPSDGGGVSAEAAFVAYCAEARMLDAIKIGCELLRLGWLDLHLLDQILTEERWRRGVAETAYVLPHLDDRFRSMPEAELFTCLVFGGLPEPEINPQVELAADVVLSPDLWFPRFRQAVEYEGVQHQEDRAQYNADIDRYSLYRKNDAGYELITKERMRSPKATVRRVHDALVARGYDGPPPVFGELWSTLFRHLSDLVRPDRRAA